MRWLSLGVVFVAACSGSSSEPLSPLSGLGFEVVAEGLVQPIWVGGAPGDDVLFIAEQPGRILVIVGAAVRDEPFLDISARVDFDTFLNPENGLLGVAFHPDYERNGRVFVNYTDQEGTVIAEYAAEPSARSADSSSEKVLLRINQPSTHHNGGMLAFGPQGNLFVGMGDGGKPEQAGDPATLLGAMLRIDVDSAAPYAIPADNPFAGGEAGAPEVWATGFRNPWRFAFDGDTLYIGDVGEERREEVNIVAWTEAGQDFGWPTLEGTLCFLDESCSSAGTALPTLEYAHRGGLCGVIGGLVYRGVAIPELAGNYLYADLCDGRIRSVELDEDRTVLEDEELSSPSTPGFVSFGSDHEGEVYVALQRGAVMKLVPLRASAPAESP